MATGQKRDLDPELVAEVAAWFRNREDIYRSSGAIAARAGVEFRRRSTIDLLIAFGRIPAGRFDNSRNQTQAYALIPSSWSTVVKR